MASNERAGQQRRKPGRQDPTQDQEQEQEQVVETEQTQEQQRDSQQDQLGNQGVAEMLGMPSVTPGSAGLGLSAAEKGEDQDHDLQFGGDDDLPADGPLTLDDLTRSWNQGTKRGNDATTFAEPMPSEDLPPEDAALLDAIRADPHAPQVPPLTTVDGMVQPSAQAVAGDLTPWVRQALAWAREGIAHRAAARLVLPPAPCLQDPWGRMAISRARAAAITSLLVVDGPTLSSSPDPLTSALVDMCLELAGRSGVVDAVDLDIRAGDTKLPVAKQILEPWLAGRRARQVAPQALPPVAGARVRGLLAELLDQPSARSLLPELSTPAAEEAEDADPLGLDDVLAQFTGGAVDPDAGLYDAAVQAAEKLAAACARLRVRTVGVSVALAETADLWTAGAPTENLLWVAAQLDQEVNRILQLLVEIARAAQGRQVAPPGLRNGLKRAATWIDRANGQVPALLATIVGGVLPGLVEVLAPPDPPPEDPLELAWGDGTPRDALGWIEGLDAGLERDLALVFTRAAADRADRAPGARHPRRPARRPTSAGADRRAGAGAVPAARGRPRSLPRVVGVPRRGGSGAPQRGRACLWRPDRGGGAVGPRRRSGRCGPALPRDAPVLAHGSASGAHAPGAVGSARHHVTAGGAPVPGTKPHTAQELPSESAFRAA